MIARLDGRGYDCNGQELEHIPEVAARVMPPMARFVDTRLAFQCTDLAHLCRFLRVCRYVSDEEQFGIEDHWIPPDEFERHWQGDCEDFALWAWRQVMALGFEARFVLGRRFELESGHAWVTFLDEGETWLLEPTSAHLGLRFPRAKAMQYRPIVSVAVSEVGVRYHLHENFVYTPTLRERFELRLEYLSILVPYWLRSIPRIPSLLLQERKKLRRR